MKCADVREPSAVLVKSHKNISIYPLLDKSFTNQSSSKIKSEVTANEHMTSWHMERWQHLGQMCTWPPSAPTVMGELLEEAQDLPELLGQTRGFLSPFFGQMSTKSK